MYYSNYNKYVGKKGEEIAEKYLKKKGYLFVARNYWTEYGEIDLVFWKGFCLVFVEVKTRSGTRFGTGREAVDYSKKKNILNTAKDFIKAHCSKNKAPFYLGKIPLKLRFYKTRFDVVEVSSNEKNGEYKINAHLKDYFHNKKI